MIKFCNIRFDPPSPAGPDGGGPEGRRGLAIHPALRQRLEEARRREPARSAPRRFVPLDARSSASGLSRVDDAEGLGRLAVLASQLPLLCVGLDFEYRHGRPGVFLKRVNGEDRHWHDPRSVEPLLLALTLVEQIDRGPVALHRFVIDVRPGNDVSPLKALLRLPVPFAAHFWRADLPCLWRLGLPEPGRVWDTWVAERAAHLGLGHWRYGAQGAGAEQGAARDRAEQEAALRFDLLSVCNRRGVRHSFAGDKARLRLSFLEHGPGQPFTREQLEYASADAEAAAQLYLPQVEAAATAGCLDHLVQVEMPWAVTNARMVWNGVRVDPGRCRAVTDACARHGRALRERLASEGLGNPHSRKQVEGFFRREGLAHLFAQGGGYSFDDEALEAAEGRHPAVALVRAARKVMRLQSDKSLTGELVGADGRLHPDHRQLGAESGRNSMRDPNVGGLGRALRPVVVPDEGCLLGEADLSQIEVGIAAAVYGDRALVGMFNGSDVYTTMARRFYAGSLPATAVALTDKEFKRRHGDRRDRMKLFTLATIYNITPHGLALRLNIAEAQAEAERGRFLGMFPALAEALEEASACGATQGYAYTCHGLRRRRAREGPPSPWEVNWLRNTPVQGSAAAVFKAAGNRLDRRYQHYGARLVLPLHDAFVFEAPRRHFGAVAKLTAEVLRGAVQERFPELDPQVEINADSPSCWNKDGKDRSLALWLIRPELAAGYL